MPNYQDGKIYTIRNYTDDSLIYVGSTIDTLSRRLAEHRYKCKAGSHISLHSHIVDNDWSNWYIELYEYYPCNNKVELNKREGEVIRELATINKNIAGRTNKEWREENANKLKEKKKKYYKDNTDKINEKHKEYYEENTYKLKEYRKKYYEDNLEKYKEKVCCDICGAFTSKYGLARHQKTIKCTGAVK